MKKLFTLATGRTGTTFLASFFNRVIPDSVARGEERPAFLRRGYALAGRESNPLERLYFRLPRELRMRAQGDKQWYIETNNRLFASADKVIRKVFPDARIVHVVRDGRDVARSWMNRGRYFPADKGLRLTPAMVPGDPHVERWAQMNPLERVAWNWVANNRIIESQRPDALYFFEGFFRPPYGEMFRLLDSLEGLEYDRDKVTEALQTIINPSHTYVFPKWDAWTREWQDQFWAIAGPSMQHYGYSREGYGQPSARMTS